MLGQHNSRRCRRRTSRGECRDYVFSAETDEMHLDLPSCTRVQHVTILILQSGGTRSDAITTRPSLRLTHQNEVVCIPIVFLVAQVANVVVLNVSNAACQSIPHLLERNLEAKLGFRRRSEWHATTTRRCDPSLTRFGPGPLIFVPRVGRLFWLIDMIADTHVRRKDEARHRQRGQPTAGVWVRRQGRRQRGSRASVQEGLVWEGTRASWLSVVRTLPGRQHVRTHAWDGKC